MLLALLVASPAVQGKAQPRWVETTVGAVREVGGHPVVILEAGATSRVLPIWIGAAEAQAIQLRAAGARAPRPLTHDLLDTTLAVLGAKIVRVEVDEIRDKIFYGKLILKGKGGKTFRIDGRPSDLIALAVGAKLPIFVDAGVMRAAGIDSDAEPDQLPGQQPAEPSPSPSPAPEPGSPEEVPKVPEKRTQESI